MITFLITPVKSKRDSLLFDTPAQRLTFDVAETPVLLNSIAVNELKQIQALNSTNTHNKRESLCSISIETLTKRQSIYTDKRQSICTINSCIEPYVGPLVFEGENEFELLEFDDDITPAQIFNQTINKLNNNHKNTSNTNGELGIDVENIENINDNINNNINKNEIITHTLYNNDYYITMLITKETLSQQKIQQYLIENNDTLNINPNTHINIIKSCECIPCKYHNWNYINIKWENQYPIQQFQFNILNAISISNNGLQQLIDVNCNKITNILTTNGVLQKEMYINAQKTFYRKKGIRPKSCRKKIRRKTYTNTIKNNKNINIKNSDRNCNSKAKDKKIMLQHLATWSSANCVTDYSLEYIIDLNTNYCSMNHNYEYLPLIGKEDNGCSYISGETLMNIISGSFDYTNLFDYYIIIDCRYEYEYNGGHIKNAINISDKLLIELLFKSNLNIQNIESQRIAWIFHCEYSKHRGPKTCKYFRELDRKENEYRYPFVSFPHVYVLEGGYKKFWNTYKNKYMTLKNNIFKPYGYISMWNELFDDKRFIYGQFRDNVWEKKKKHAKILTRANTRCV